MKLHDADNFFIQICQSLDNIQDRCLSDAFLKNKEETLTPEESRDFYGVVCFLNELYYESEDYELAFVSMIENMLNGYMLGQFIIESHQARNKERLTAGIKLVWHLSRTLVVTAEQLIIVRPADDRLELLRIFTDISLLTGAKTGLYCLRILQALLQKDREFLRQLMEIRILEKINDVLERRELEPAVLAEAIVVCT